ncbi:hypothetical protein KUTeg_024817 [Tegillarca granosa]|uniref:Uncharacterized protein n=1 Tax=Tegillarca granosa TaxID=220873 RepID=A0ABQ9E3I5_TEGGR|nr:hypothetical protein KUTeg_024817 [Tegillarca granosa]
MYILFNRISGTYGCPMSLMKYPLDKQKCILEMESCKYCKNMVTVLRHCYSGGIKTHVEKSPDLTLPQFKFGKLNSYVCDRKYSGVLYTCIGLDFELQREYGFYIIQVYVPSIMTVLLSWVSFWINADATPARTTLGLVTVLTIATQSVGLMSGLPRVSYIKAIDVWYSVCLVFVVTAFLEFAWVNVLSRVSNRKKKTIVNPSIKLNHEDIAATEKQDMSIRRKSKLEKVKELAREDRARIVDKASRVIFPLAFIIFNAVYWTYYFLWEP